MRSPETMISRSSPEIPEQIKDRLTIRGVCERYGVHFDSHGRALCPFHTDHHPSANIKGEKFHCSVCDIHGDIFDFTQRMFSMDFRQAMLRLNEDFGLGLLGEKPDPIKLQQWRRDKAHKAAELAAYRAEYDRNVLLHRYIIDALRVATKPKRHAQAIRRARWAEELEYLDYYFDSHPWK